MDVRLLATPADCADAIAALARAAPLPECTVLVASERQAHALRRALVRAGRTRALAGTRFVGPAAVAEEILRGAGVELATGEEALRPARLGRILREAEGLEHFPPALFAATRGWEDAFARTIGDLERAGLSPADLARGTPHARDVGRVWERLERAAGRSLTAARVLREAAERLAADPRLWPHDGGVLALATGHESAVLALFLRAIPGLALGLLPARPLRARFLSRVERLFGPGARDALVSVSMDAETPAATERDVLARDLFAPPRDGARATAGRTVDGSVELEEHAGAVAELEATAAWVAREVLERNVPAEEIAVLVPAHDPLAGLVAARLERLSSAGVGLPVYVAGGLPASATAAGARLLATVRALLAHLAAESLVPVLAAIRPAPGAEPAHLSTGEALELAFGLGTVGGNAACPEGALDWTPRAARRLAELDLALARARTDEDSAAREVKRLERTRRNLAAVSPGLDRLVDVARLVVEERPLADVWAALHGFLSDALLLPGEGPALLARLAEAVSANAAALGDGVRGEDALRLVERRLGELAIPRGRFGEPAIYVGTVASAVGLDFTSVRIVGLAEGVLPSAPREDPVLPEALRETLASEAPGRVVGRAEDRVLEELHHLVRAIGAARARVALSAPRVDLEGTEREPAAVFVEAAAALSRGGGAPARLAELARGLFVPSRTALAAFRRRAPVDEAAWQERVARVAPELPPPWRGEPALDLGRIAALRAPTVRLGPADGVLGDGDPFPPLPGLTPERPISASALGDLLRCPRLFLMKRVLGWDEPACAPPLRELDALAYGGLLHRVVEAFYRAHGADVAEGRRPLEELLARAREIADAHFELFLSEVPLVGEAARANERERLRDDVAAFVRHDRGESGRRRFVDVERAFGHPVPVALTPSPGAPTLHVHGYIDRVDVDGAVTLVRDLKSGKPHPRAGAEREPTPELDVQLGLYLLAARALAPEWRTPAEVAGAYVYPGRGDLEERAFRGDAAVLLRAAESWLATAGGLLRRRGFPSSPAKDGCRYCPFSPLCGTAEPARAKAGLASEEEGPLAAYRALALDEEDEG
jgi:hypothetical protein